MHRTQCLLVLLLLIAVPVPAAAQRDAGAPRRTPRTQAPPPSSPDAGVETTTEEATEPVEEEGETTDEAGTSDEFEEPRLRPPTLEPMLEPPVGSEETEPEEEDAEAESPDDAADRLEASAPPTSDPTEALGWTAPQSIFTLHGYFRVRGEMQDTFFLGREPEPGADNQFDWPFGRFRPFENGETPPGGCADDPETDMDEADACDTEALGFANMRLRLQPTLSLSEDVRVHMLFDVFDNMVLGSTPNSLLYGATGSAAAPSEFDSTGQNPPVQLSNSLSDSIVARRAWAEVTNRSLGQLRFGRMGWHWGLGLFANSGDGLDADYQTDVDRIMGITKLAGLYVIAAYDFASEGLIQQSLVDVSGLAWDAAQDDDVDQYMIAVARRMDEEDQAAALDRGEVVLNGGLFFLYRDQFLTSAASNPLTTSVDTPVLARRGAEAFIPDAWVQLRWRGLRIELEAALVAGSIENISNEGYDGDEVDLLEFGGALETEYRLLDDKLGLYFYAGFATGDADVDGLTTLGRAEQTDDTVSTFRFHPNYRVDLILWRNIMRQVSGAYYLRPGISYDFIRSPFGQLLGGRVDLIWSRASQPVQTWGSDADLGIEINASLYYRSEDGPELLDGFYGSVQYGVLFPMKGLGYPSFDGQPLFPGGNPDLDTAQTLRLLLGVQF